MRRTVAGKLRIEVQVSTIDSIMFNSGLQLTAGDILTLLVILAVILLIVVLFNIIFVSMALRRIAKRADIITKEAEAVIIKPLQTVDAAVEWFTSFLSGWHDSKHKKKGKHKNDDVIDV
jgi:hypothetical protein